MKTATGMLRGRGSSPQEPERFGKDDWVRGVRMANGTSAEWLANERAERLASAPLTDNENILEDRQQRREAQWEW